MRAISTVAAAAMLAASVPAGAQSAPSPPPARTAPAGAPNPLQQQDVSKIIGANVYDDKGNEIGDIATVLMDPKTRVIDRFVVRVLVARAGGILGVGGRLVALPISAFSWMAKKPGFEVAASAQELKSMAVWTGAPAQGEAAAASGTSAQGGSSAPAH